MQVSVQSICIQRRLLRENPSPTQEPEPLQTDKNSVQLVLTQLGMNWAVPAAPDSIVEKKGTHSSNGEAFPEEFYSRRGQTFAW